MSGMTVDKTTTNCRTCNTLHPELSFTQSVSDPDKQTSEQRDEMIRSLILDCLKRKLNNDQIVRVMHAFENIKNPKVQKAALTFLTSRDFVKGPWRVQWPNEAL
jgi:hypothetical protein